MQTGERPDSQSGAGPRPSVEDLLAVLRQRFGDRYEKPYDVGKREFQDAIAAHFELDDGTASALINSLEAAGSIRFKSGGDSSTRDAGGPRVGLFDEPGPPRDETFTPEPGGRYWLLGRDDTAPGAF